MILSWLMAGTSSVEHTSACSWFWPRSVVDDGAGREGFIGEQRRGRGEVDGWTVCRGRDMAASQIHGTDSGDGRLETGVAEGA